MYLIIKHLTNLLLTKFNVPCLHHQKKNVTNLLLLKITWGPFAYRYMDSIHMGRFWERVHSAGAIYIVYQKCIKLFLNKSEKFKLTKISSPFLGRQNFFKLNNMKFIMNPCLWILISFENMLFVILLKLLEHSFALDHFKFNLVHEWILLFYWTCWRAVVSWYHYFELVWSGAVSLIYSNQ